MRILLIAAGRVGGTRIGEWIGYETNIEYLHEPFSEWRNDINSFSNKMRKENDSMVVKVFPGEEWDRVKNLHWDKIIGITRNDVRGCAESNAIALETNVWHSNYIVDTDWLSKNEDKIKSLESDINHMQSEILNNNYIELFVTYEGVFETGEDVKHIINYLDISNPKCDAMLDSKYRYKKTNISELPITKKLL